MNADYLIYGIQATCFIAFCVTWGKNRGFFFGLLLGCLGPLGMIYSFMLEDRSTIKCEECKSYIPHDAKVCTKCGAKVSKK